MGDHYNNSNYKYTAPVAGHYYFAFNTICSTALTNGHIGFVLSAGTHSGYNFHFTFTSGGWDQLAISGVYYLPANATVDVRNHGSGLTVHGATWNKFSGHLLG